MINKCFAKVGRSVGDLTEFGPDHFRKTMCLRFDLGLVFAFDHHAGKVFGAGISEQQTAFCVKLFFDLAARPGRSAARYRTAVSV